MKEYINFDNLIKDGNFSLTDRNNLISIILLLHRDKKSVEQLGKELNLLNVKVKYYVDYLEEKGILRRYEVHNSLVTKTFEYELVTKEIIGTMEATNELGKKIQAKRLGIYLEDSVENLNSKELNLISLAEVSLEPSVIREINEKLKILYNYIMQKEQEALIAEKRGDLSIKRYSLLTSFIPISVE